MSANTSGGHSSSSSVIGPPLAPNQMELAVGPLTGSLTLSDPFDEAEWSATNADNRDDITAPGYRQRPPRPSHGRAL
jgi:hypothetical protein